MPGRRGLFRILLRALPRDVRVGRAEELMAFWEMQASETRYQGVWGRVRLGAALARDVVASRARTSTRIALESTTKVMGGVGMLRTTWQDVRYAKKALTGAPLFTVLAALTLSSGIGTITAVYSVVSTVVLDPLPYPQAELLVDVRRTARQGRTPAVSWPDFRDWRDRSRAFVALGAYAEAERTFEWNEGAEAIPGARVTRDFFEVMGVPPALGRTFTADEDRLHGSEAVVLGHGLWQSRFGGDPSIVGRTLPLDGVQVPVVGVMPEGFAAPDGGARFWEPLQDDELLESVGLPTGTRSLNFLTVVGRLAPGVPRQEAQTRLRAVAAALDEEVQRNPDRRAAPVMVSLLHASVGDVRPMFFIVLGAAVLVLLVGTANAAGLALSRAAARERELAVRSALGAPRGRLARQLLTEGGLLAGVAAVLGCGITWGLQRALTALAPPGLPRIDAVRLDVDTVTVLLLSATVSGLLLGLVPALRCASSAHGAALAGGRGNSAGRRALRPQRALVSFQVALSVILLTGAVLLSKSFARLTAVELGFDPIGTILASVQPSESRYDGPEALDAFYARLLESVRAIPGVDAATTTYSPPFANNGFRTSVTPEGVEEDEENPTMAGTVIVREGYFETNGVPILAGRAFDGSERLGEPPVAIVSRSLADRFWPGLDPLGKRFVFTGGLRGSAESFEDGYFPEEPYTVIGVAGNVRRDGHADEPPLEYYRPHSQITWGFQYLMVRTVGAPDRIAEALRRAVWDIDPTVPVRTVRTLDSYVSESVAAPRFRMLLVGTFALVTGLLAMVGLYAVTALAVTRSKREMGIRKALGAERQSIVRSVLLQGLRPVVAGALAGTAVSFFANRLLSQMLFQVEPSDAGTYAAVVVLAGSVAMVACYGPAHRAARVDPVLSLGEE